MYNLCFATVDWSLNICCGNLLYLFDRFGGNATGEYGAAVLSTVVTFTVVALVDPSPTDAFKLSTYFISCFVLMYAFVDSITDL